MSIGKQCSVAASVVTGLLFATVIAAFAHGMNYTLLESPSVTAFQAQFSTGELMSYSPVTIIDPEGEEYQSGLTDRRGRFAFMPEGRGEWRIAVDGGMGHRLTFALEVSNGTVEMMTTTAPQWLYALIGVSLIFNFGFGVAVIRANKKTP